MEKEGETGGRKGEQVRKSGGRVKEGGRERVRWNENE